MTVDAARYWDDIAERWQETRPQTLWRDHSDAVNAALFARWLPAAKGERLLKTDLFDEAVSDGLYPLLSARARHVVGIDLSTTTARAAQAARAALLVAVADVRRLPFASATFDLVISNSTLDHFESAHEIMLSLCELARTLKPGGCLLLTLDNPLNPVLALRQALPLRMLNRLGVVPYYVGATLSPRQLRRAVQEAGFAVEQLTAVMHCPRALAIIAAQILDQIASPAARNRFGQLLMACESLEQWPTRFLTGYFVAIKAYKKE